MVGNCGSASSVATPLKAPEKTPALNCGNTACSRIKTSGNATRITSSASVITDKNLGFTKQS